MKKDVLKIAIVGLIITLFASCGSGGLNGTYVAKNEAAKQSMYTKFIFKGGKVKVIMGAAGFEMPGGYEYPFSRVGDKVSIQLKVSGVSMGSVDLHYNEKTDELRLLLGGEMGTALNEYAPVWAKEGSFDPNKPQKQREATAQETQEQVAKKGFFDKIIDFFSRMFGKKTEQPKDVIVPDDTPEVETDIVTTPTKQSVYVVTAGYWDGDENDPQGKKIFTPRLWKDGKVQNLTTKIGTAHSVFVSGNDVYVAGNQNGYATLWKNGVAQQLSKEQGGGAYSVFVFGNDVYVAGEDNSVAILWKNKVAQKLTDGNNWACANSVFVSEKDVYVVGIEDQKAILWKNGVKQILAEGTNANSVFVSGNDVYVAGEGNSVAILWKNGTPQNLNKDKKYGARANSVFVSGKNVYVAGTDEERGTAKLWKNGVEQKLTNSRGSDAFSVFVSGNDVYVAGWENGFATLWKNGAAQKLLDVRSVFATSVFVNTEPEEQTPPTPAPTSESSTAPAPTPAPTVKPMPTPTQPKPVPTLEELNDLLNKIAKSDDKAIDKMRSILGNSLPVEGATYISNVQQLIADVSIGSHYRVTKVNTDEDGKIISITVSK